MKRLTIYITDKQFEKLREMREEGKIRSMSEFIRNLLSLYLFSSGGGVVYTRVMERYEFYPFPYGDKKHSSTKIGYGSHHKEVVNQLLQAFKQRFKSKDTSNEIKA